LAALLDAMNPWRAPDGYMSYSAIGRSSPEVLALAEALLTAQPSPEVSPGAEVAAVLAGLVEEMTAKRKYLFDGLHFEQSAGLRIAIEMVEAAQAATGARAAGGESAADVLDRLRTESPRHLTREELPEHYAAPYALTPEPAYTPTSDPETLARRFHEAYERLAPSFGYETREASAKPWAEVPENNRKLMIAVCAEIAAALPAPVAPGVAELLAECERRTRDEYLGVPGTAYLSCRQIRRYLAPGGADGEGEGT
jgi:hypothetical protein